MKLTQGQDPTHKKILLTSLSAMVAESTTFPIDITKTRLQLHASSTASSAATNAFKVAINIVRNEGFLGLYQGLSPAIIRHLFYTPIRIVGYEYLRNAVLVAQNQHSDAVSGSLSLSSKALVGGLSGVIAQEHANQVRLSS